MVNDFTLVRADNIMSVDGVILQFPFGCENTIHAIQWHDGKGQVERENPADNIAFDESEYDHYVAPFVTVWQNEKQRVETARAKALKEAEEKYNSLPERWARLRRKRNALIAETDYLLMPDYPITAECRANLTAYRQALRDITKQDGAPWDDNTIPWPVMPEVVKE